MGNKLSSYKEKLTKRNEKDNTPIACTVLTKIRVAQWRPVSSQLLYLQSFYFLHTFSYTNLLPFWPYCERAAAILSEISGNANKAEREGQHPKWKFTNYGKLFEAISMVLMAQQRPIINRTAHNYNYTIFQLNCRIWISFSYCMTHLIVWYLGDLTIEWNPI